MYSSARYQAPELQSARHAIRVGEVRTISGKGLLGVGLTISQPIHSVLNGVEGLVVEIFPTRMLKCPQCVETRA